MSEGSKLSDIMKYAAKTVLKAILAGQTMEDARKDVEKDKETAMRLYKRASLASKEETVEQYKMMAKNLKEQAENSYEILQHLPKPENTTKELELQVNIERFKKQCEIYNECLNNIAGLEQAQQGRSY